MKTKIAVFGRKEIIDRLHACISGQTDIEIVPFMYTYAKETPSLIEKAFVCDIYLFTEVLSFLSVKETINKKRLPNVLIPCDDYMVLASLFHAKRDRHNLNRLSIDVWDKHFVNGVLPELNIKNHGIYTHLYGDDVLIDIEQIVKSHQSLWESGKIDHVLTSIKEVEEQLKENNVPVTCMEFPEVNLESTIKEAKAIATLHERNSTQIVIGYVHLKETSGLGGHAPKIHQIIRKFTDQTDATVVPNAENQLIIFGTTKLLNYITNHFRDFPLLKKLKGASNVVVNIGFGLDLTAKQADANARLALERCRENENSNCYIVNERQDVIGPLGVKKHFDPAELYQSLIHKARLNNELSYNFIDFITHRNNEPFSSHDIAVFYRVTKRSAERTINKLLVGKVIKVVGEEKPYIKGRPRKLFQLVV